MEDTYTTKGRKVFEDPETGDNFSERTITFETKYGWVTIPTVNAEGEQFSQEELEAFIEENGPVDPLTGEELPVFDSEPEASEYAQTRSDGLLPEVAEDIPLPPDAGVPIEAPMEEVPIPEESAPIEMFHGGMMMPEMMVGMDEESGNPVPPGSSEMNVRDDIPAALSDGEYVVPADVVRWHGLKHLMEMRDEAKMGLMAMQMEGQIETLEEEYEEDEEYMEDEDEAYEADEEEYETPEGNSVDVAITTIEEETLEDEEEDPYKSTDGKNTYRPAVKFAMMKR